MAIERGHKWNPWDRKPHEPRVGQQPERSGQGPLDRKLSRRSFVAGGLAAALTLAAGGKIAWDNLGDDNNEPTISDGGRPLPTSTPGSTPEATPYATPSPTAVVESSPTYTPTREPSPTPSATPTEVPPTPTEVPPTATPEAIRYTGVLPFEIKSNTPEFLPFDTMVLNPQYPDAEAALHYLGLRALAQLRYAAETPYQDFDLNAANNPDIPAFEQEMLHGNVEFQVPGHPPEEMDVSSPIRMVTVRPEQGIRLEVAVDRNQIDRSNPANSEGAYDGNMKTTAGAQFRLGVDSNGKAVLRLIHLPEEGKEKNYLRSTPLHILSNLRAGLELFRFKEKLTNQKPDLLDDGLEDPMIMDTMIKHVDGMAIDYQYVYDWNGPVAPIMIFDR